MKIARLHRWPTTPGAAIALQKELAPCVRLTPAAVNVRLFAGTDVAFSPDGKEVIAGAVVWDGHAMAVVEERLARVACRLPYIPGLLSFRELPGVLAALRTLEIEPEVVLCDAQGLAHPRRLGLASHLGLWLERPTVGCAKSRLCGRHDEPGTEKGNHTGLWHDGERVGSVLCTRDNVKPLFVSPGHLCDHGSAIRLTLAATTRYRLPEPTRLAHQLVTRARAGAVRGSVM
jgi:deoxyribonuclease V